MENHVRLIVINKHMSTPEISNAVGIQDQLLPASTERAPIKVLEFAHGLMIESNLECSSDLALHIQALMKFTQGAEQRLLKFSQLADSEVQVSCALYCNTAPPVNFGKTETNWIGSIGASLDVDIYFTGEI